jgi:hypothetical protein
MRIVVQLHETWRYEYDRDSYLSHLSHSELCARARYLIENLTTLELNGKIGLRNVSKEPGHTLMRKFIHAHQELVRRKKDFEPMFLKGASIPKAMLGKEHTLKRLNQYAIEKNPHLIKFGKKKFLSEYSFKVSLASTFSDLSLNAAQMDDEMRAIYKPHPKDVKLTTLDGQPIDEIFGIELTYQISNDYYVFCSSFEFDVRLFGDFESDACLFIYDSQNFSNQLYEKMAAEVEILDHGYKPVTYVDPIRPSNGKPPPVEFHKHMKYLYQNEFRHVFIPKKQIDIPKDLYIFLPEAEKYTELVFL